MIKRQPLRDAAQARRREGASELRKLLDSLPPNLYSEEETNQLIEEAIQATKGHLPSHCIV